MFMERYVDWFTFYGAWIIALMIAALPLHILMSIPQSKLFARAGEAQWKAWVPFVSHYTRAKIVFGQDKAWWFLIDFVLGWFFGVYFLFSLYVGYNEARAFGRKPIFAICHAIFPPVTLWIMFLSKDDYQGTQRFILN